MIFYHFGMRKIARSRAKNPEQERLREEKSDWNSDASSLIGKLIALKQSINGRGNKVYNLPPSRIHEPFPPEINSFWSETNSEAQKVLQDARQIIDFQDHASHKKIASSSLSRFWAKIKLYFSLNKEIYNNRIRMLSEAASIQKTLERIQKEVLEQDPESVAIALTDGALLRTQFMGPFSQNYDQLLEKEWEKKKIQFEIEKQKKEENSITDPNEIEEKELPLPENDLENIPDSNIVTFKKPINPDGSNITLSDPDEPPTQKREKRDLEIQEVLTKQEENANVARIALSELPVISSVVTYIQSLDSLPEISKKRIKNVFNTFSQFLASYEILKKDPSVLLKEKEIEENIASDYRFLLDLAQKNVGPGKNFTEIFSNLNPEIKQALLYTSIIKVAQQQKEAKEGIYDWMKRKFKLLNTDSFQRLAMECVRLASKSERALNDLMDDLEKKNVTIQIIDNKLSIFARLLQAFLQKLLILGRMQSSNIRRFDRSKDWNQISVQVRDLTELQKFITELEIYSKPYDFGGTDGLSIVESKN